MHAHMHTVPSLEAELLALHAAAAAAAGTVGSACMHVFNADTLRLCQTSSAFVYLQQSREQRASREPEIAQRRREGEGWMCSSGMETCVSCYRIIISLQSPSTSAALRQRTHTPTSGWTTTTLICVCTHQGPFTPVLLLDHQKTHLLMSWRRDFPLIQTLQFRIPLLSLMLLTSEICFL